MGHFDRTILAHKPDRVPRAQDLHEGLLQPAGLHVGATAGPALIVGAEIEGDHLRLDVTFAGESRDFAILVRPRDDGAAAFLRSHRWNVGYRGQAFDRGSAALLGDVAVRLERVAEGLGLDAAGAHARWFFRPGKDDFLEITAGKKLYIRVTDHCDEACLFCNATEGNANIVPSRRTVEDILRGLPVGSLTQVIFSGGEPTLVKGLPEMVGLAYDRGARDIIVQTNGVALAAPGALDAYLPYRDRLGIGFSLHATDALLSAQMIDHADQGRLPAKIAAIDRAVALGFRVKITCVVMRPNLAQVPAFAQWAWDRYGPRLTRLQFSYAMPRGNAWLNQHLLLRFDECTGPFAEAFELGRRTGMRVETSQSACVPPCVMPDYLDHYDIYGDFRGRTADPERVKPPEVCGGCKWDRLCAGVWQRYLDVHGAGELHAITDREDPGMVIDDFLDAEVLELTPC